MVIGTVVLDKQTDLVIQRVPDMTSWRGKERKRNERLHIKMIYVINLHLTCIELHSINAFIFSSIQFGAIAWVGKE